MVAGKKEAPAGDRDLRLRAHLLPPGWARLTPSREVKVSGCLRRPLHSIGAGSSLGQSGRPGVVRRVSEWTWAARTQTRTCPLLAALPMRRQASVPSLPVCTAGAMVASGSGRREDSMGK